MEETILIERVQGGDIGAFEVLMDGHLRRVRAFISLRLPIPHLIDELAHETFLFAFQHISEFKVGTSFSSWLIAIAGNLIRTEVLRFRREQMNHEKYAEKYLFDLLEEPQLSANTQELDLLQSCLDRVPSNLRNLLDLKYRLGLSTEEMATKLQQSSAWVRTTLFRTRHQLRKCVDTRGGALP